MADQKLFRNTRQRRMILKELQSLTSHPTATELYEIVRQRLPKISLGTVYRNLELLSQNGQIRKLELGGAEARFDGDLSRHYHVRCAHCGKVDDIRDLPGDLVREQVREMNGYRILGHRLEFVGVCPDCRDKPSATGDSFHRVI